jgi:hypothetical protein
MSSIARVLHTTTWDYFIRRLANRFIRSPKVVKEEIMRDINDLVQEFWTTSGDEAVGASFFAMRRLLEILQHCLDLVCFFFDIYVFATAVDLADINLQMSTNFWQYCAESLDDLISLKAKFKIMFDGYREMIYQSFSISKELGDILRFLPGVVVQKPLSMQGMVELYRIKPDSLGRLNKSIIAPLSQTSSLWPPNHGSIYGLDDYLSGLLQDRERSQLYYCDPELQHISICRQFLSLLDRSNVFDLQS